MGLTVGCTGHRPRKLGRASSPTGRKILEETRKMFREINPSRVLSGMALGYDQWFVEVAIEFMVPFIAYVPFLGQEELWSVAQKQHYRYLLSRAQEIKVICPGDYAAWKLLRRNEAIVQDCDLLIACWNGDTFGGTFHCVQEALKVNRPTKVIVP